MRHLRRAAARHERASAFVIRILIAGDAGLRTVGDDRAARSELNSKRIFPKYSRAAGMGFSFDQRFGLVFHPTFADNFEPDAGFPASGEAISTSNSMIWS